ncbi:MAG: 2-oxoacid:acceptor oxidoreductase subunit alpha [Bacillota bacterium]|jgi:2-oxoglutarate ferredoxin oxidoreductase subunit alpha|nr:2-oxoacid:acceptor oxidoreductase subunit alpha [Bacillota bacterium]
MQTFNIKIGGEAGQGLVSVGNILLRAAAREGWYLFAHQDYESRIRGGHNFFQIRLSDEPVATWEKEIDVLVALDEATVILGQDELRPGGIVIYDPGVLGDEAKKLVDQPNCLGLPFAEIAEELGQPRIVANAAAAGAVWALLSEDLTVLHQTLESMFESKGESVAAGNQRVAAAGFNRVRELAGSRPKPAKPEHPAERLLLQGNAALPLGALAAGLKFMSAYPMTPATGVTEFIAQHGREASVVMEQAEDEISAINMAIGASFAGVRAMTATSGGGFALMTEALSLAGSAEIPIVVINAMRPGPSTGLPTRTEQGDLRYAAAMSFGDFPRAVLAPGDVEEAFYLMGQAFNLADEYQMPVVVLSDQHLADSHVTVPPFDLSKVEIRRGKVVAGAEAGPDYLRYKYTEDGVSPRLYPGFGEGVVVSAGDEHDEKGHLIEDAETRQKMMEKRMAKQKLVEAAALEPVLCGAEEPDAMLIGFGSTKGAIREAVRILNEGGCKVQGVHLPQVFPLPEALGELLKRPARKFVVEGNFTGQLEELIAARFAIKPTGSIRRYDGRPINAQYILDKLRGGVCGGQ